MELFKNTIKQAIKQYNFTNLIESYDVNIFVLTDENKRLLKIIRWNTQKQI